MQSVAGFASLHCAVTLLVALMVQHTIRNRVVHWIFWANFGVTIVATLYFGWHYVADDVAGILIALLSFYVGGVVSGQKFVKHHVVTTEDAERARLAAAAASSPSRRAPATTPRTRRLRRAPPPDRSPLPRPRHRVGRVVVAPPGTRGELTPV